MTDDVQELPAPESSGSNDIATLPLIFGTVAVIALAVVHVDRRPGRGR